MTLKTTDLPKEIPIDLKGRAGHFMAEDLETPTTPANVRKASISFCSEDMSLNGKKGGPMHHGIQTLSSCVSSASTAPSAAMSPEKMQEARLHRRRSLRSLLKRVWASIMAGDITHLRKLTSVICEEYGTDILCEAHLNKHGWTALHAASYFGRLEIVQYLIETLKVKVNTKSSCGWHALTFAVMGFSATTSSEETSKAFGVI